MTSSSRITVVSDYLLWYAKDKETDEISTTLMKWDERTPDPLLKSYTHVELPDGTRRGMTKEERRKPIGCCLKIVVDLLNFQPHRNQVVIQHIRNHTNLKEEFLYLQVEGAGQPVMSL